MRANLWPHTRSGDVKFARDHLPAVIETLERHYGKKFKAAKSVPLLDEPWQTDGASCLVDGRQTMYVEAHVRRYEEVMHKSPSGSEYLHELPLREEFGRSPSGLERLLLGGIVTHYFYSFGFEDSIDLERWVLIDMKKYTAHAALGAHRGRLVKMHTPKTARRDGTGFLPIVVLSLHSDCVAGASSNHAWTLKYGETWK